MPSTLPPRRLNHLLDFVKIWVEPEAPGDLCINDYVLLMLCRLRAYSLKAVRTSSEACKPSTRLRLEPESNQWLRDIYINTYILLLLLCRFNSCTATEWLSNWPTLGSDIVAIPFSFSNERAPSRDGRLSVRCPSDQGLC